MAYAHKEKDPSVVLVGERGGRICDGFDFGNSPSQIEGAELTGKTIVHTTSAGTQGLFGAENAQVVMGASLVNAAATAAYIHQQGFHAVSLVCMGLSAETPTEEDTLCARYIQSLLEGCPIPLDEEIESLKHTSGAKFFDPSQKDVFPQEDFFLCTQVDKFPFALRLETDNRGLRYMKQIIMSKEDTL